MANATLSLLNPPLTQDNDEWIWIEWDGPVTGFDFDEAVITGDCTIESTDFTQSGESFYVRVHTADQADGTITVSLAQDVVDQGNPAVTRTFTWGTPPPPTDATLTLTTNNTDRRGGVAFTVDIDASIDISDFTIDDITVTNGTRSNFVMTDAQNFSVDITPDAGSGTVTVAIAEDVVTPGNAAVSVNFTYAQVRVLHIADGSDDNIRVIDYDTADGGTADALRTYTTTDSTDVQSIVYDGTHIHVTNWQQSTVRVYATNTADGSAAGVVRAYTVTGISQPSGMAFDGTHIHIADRASDNIRVIAPDTADGGTATILRTYTVPGLGDCRGMMFDSENIHAADYTDDNIRVFAPDTADGTDATVLRTYTVPGVNHSRSIAFDGVFVHVSDVNDDNFRVVAVPTADGAQTVLRTYTVRGVANPRGMTGIPLTPNNAPEFAQGSYTFSDIDVAVNSVAGSVVATDDDMDPISYSLTGTDASSFDIDANGQITVSTALTNSQVYTFNVEADDGTDSTAVPVTVTAVAAVSANLTITTTHGDIYAGQTVYFEVGSDIDITGFTLSDITLTGATAVGLSTFGERTWRLQTTAADGAGDIVISIASNVVSPGNAAVSETFTRNARITPTITFANTDLVPNQQTLATITFPEAVTGMTRGDLTLDVGTLGATLTTVSTTVYTIPVTAPSSGSGTMTLSIAEDAVTPPNSAVSESVNYVETLVATTLEIVSGDSQSAEVSTALANDLVVRVLDQNNDAFSGSTVTFSTTGGTLSETSVVTGADGQASTSLTLPAAEGDYTITASVTGLTDVTFTATATAALDPPSVPQSARVDPSTTTAVATWEAPENDGGSEVTNYQLTVDSNTPIDVGNVLTYTLTGLDPETDYSLSIVAQNAEGDSPAATVMFTTEAIPVPATEEVSGTYNADMGFNVLPEALGGLRRVHADGTIEDLGNVWYEERPFNATGSRMLSIGDDLHIQMGYGDPLPLLRYNSLAAANDNHAHFVHGRTLHYVIAEFNTDGTILNALENLALRIGATVSFDSNLIIVSDREPYRAQADGATGTGTGNIDFHNANKTFPTSGYLKIGDEFIQFTGISGNAFTGIVRGVLGTTVVNHPSATEILYLDNLLYSDDIEDIRPSTDTGNFYNVIRDGGNQFEVADDNNPYQRKAYTLDLGTSRHERAWTESVFARYLRETKDIQDSLEITAGAGKNTNALDIGQVVATNYHGLLFVFRVVGVTTGENIRLTGRTIT